MAGKIPFLVDQYKLLKAYNLGRIKKQHLIPLTASENIFVDYFTIVLGLTAVNVVVVAENACLFKVELKWLSIHVRT